MKSNTELAKLFKKQRDHAKRGLGKQYDNTVMTQSFYNDNQSSFSDTVQFADDNGRRRRAMVNFQKIQQSVDSVVGFMAQNRRQAKYIARINDDQSRQLYSRNMNALYTFHREVMNADQLESKQDLDLVVNGYGAIETDLSYIVGNATTDPNGQILKVKLDPMRIYWDSNSRSANISDARYCGYYNDYELKDALDLFQGSKEDDFEPVSDSSVEDRAGYSYNPWGGLYDKIKLDNSVEWSAKEEDMVRVYNHQWFEYETFYKCKNPLFVTNDVYTALHAKMRLDMIKSELKSYSPTGINAGDMFDFDPLAEEIIFDGSTKTKLTEEFGNLIDPVSFKRKCFYTMVISGDHVFSKFKSISQQGFSVKFKTGNYNERGKYWIGMVNSMIEPQKYYNKALTELMFTIAANSKGGVMVEESAIEDIADFESKWSKTDAVIRVQDGAISGQKILQKTQAALPTGLESIIQLADTAISANGVDPAFLGQANDNETGVLYKRRIRQIISKMWWVADSITLYQKEDARLCADLIRVWVENNAGQWLRITGKDGADQFVQISEDMMAPEYDVSIQEGAQSPEDRQETAQFISSMGDKFLAVQDSARAGTLYAESIKLLPLDGDVKNRISQTLNPEQQTVPMAQYQQLQQQLQQLQGQMNQAQVQNVQSMTALNTAKIDESKASAMQKKADSMTKIQEAHQKEIETNVIRTHASQARINV
jgi:hypothetical protein